MVLGIKEEIYNDLERDGFGILISNTPNSRLHSHEFLEFSYLESGSVEHSFGKETKRLYAGDYFIVDHGTEHQYRSADEIKPTMINFLFHADFVDRTLGKWDDFDKIANSYLIRFKYRSLNYSPTGITFHDESGEVHETVRKIIREYNTREAGYLECIRCLIVQMFIIIMRKIGKRDGRGAESAVINEICKYLKDNYAERITLSEFAKKYSYSLSHISKKFTEELGVGFTQYLQRIRIEQSCRLLESGELSVSEVASRVGYGDVKFFNKVFRETLGVTPREFKKMSK